MRPESRLEKNATFALTADSGELAWQAERLVRSIRHHVPESNVVVFVPERSVPEIDTELMEYFENQATVVRGEIPIPEYPISAMVQAFVEAERVSDTEYLVALDTDTLVLGPPRIYSEGELWARPADVGVQYWTSDAARADWGKLCDAFDVPKATEGDRLTSTVDRQPIPPYFNSGVVVTTDRTLPARWLDITATLVERDDLPVGAEEFFTDQIALALAALERKTSLLDQRTNYPLGGRLRVQSDVEVLHYGDRRNLARILNPDIRQKLRSLGALPPLKPAELGHSLLDIGSTQSGKILSRTQKQAVRRALERVL